MFRRTRERFERLEAMIAKLSEPVAPRPTDTAETFAKLLGTVMTSQSDLVGSLGDIAVRSVARRNGIKGGTQRARTAQRRPDGKFLPRRRSNEANAGFDPDCSLCLDPTTRDVSIPGILAHRRHEEARRAARRLPDSEPSQDADTAPDGVTPNGAIVDQ